MSLFRKKPVQVPAHPLPESYYKILKEYWGYDSFRGIQEDIISSISLGYDTLGLMPTGGGKSITFQVPTLAMEGLCLVITPLIALMKDQVQHLRNRGILAQALHNGMTQQEILTALDNCIYGNYKFLYVSPERLSSNLFLQKIRRIPVSLLAVDESHCISQWGYDFRPAYLQIASIRQLLPGVPVLALTATAIPAVIEDIQQRLHFARPNVFRMSFERTNLAYVVRPTEDKESELMHILQRVPGSAIVYVRSRKKTQEVAKLLQAQGITAHFYHAGLDDATRDLRQKEWQRNDRRVMVATNAFGMGIDKPDVRLVVHLDLPDSIEAYFQEAGRAGRDGRKAYAVILYSPSDRTVLLKRIPDTFPDKDYIRDVYEHLQYYYQTAMGEGQGMTRPFNLEDFCRTYKYFPVPVDSALKIIMQCGYLEYTAEQDGASQLLFTIGRDGLYQLQGLGENTDRLIQVILRSYTGLFTDYAYIDEQALATRAGLTRQQVYEYLIRLGKLGIVRYIPRRKTPYIRYIRERVEASRLVIPPAVYEERRERYEQRIKAMLHYVSNDSTCRSRELLSYFGENNDHNCGQCDVCLSRRHRPADGLRERALACLTESDSTAIRLAERLQAPADDLASLLHTLIEEGIVTSRDGVLHLQAPGTR